MKRADICCFILLACLGMAVSSCRPRTEGGGLEIKLQAGGGQDKAAQIERGKTIFIKASCWGCHPHGENSMHPDKPLKGPGFASKYPTDQSIIDFVRKGSPDQGMPPFPPVRLSDNDLKNVVAYVRSLSEH